MNERDWQTAVIDFARLFGWRVHHTRPAVNRSGRWSTPIQGDVGFPDLVLAHADGHVIFAELKSNTGRVSVEQNQWLRTLTAGNVDVHVWQPRHSDQVATILSHGRVTTWNVS